MKKGDNMLSIVNPAIRLISPVNGFGWPAMKCISVFSTNLITEGQDFTTHTDLGTLYTVEPARRDKSYNPSSTSDDIVAWYMPGPTLLILKV